jgi:inorganic pyrophosphatase/exopolyphosphatase
MHQLLTFLAKDLKDLANVDLDEYGLEMLKAGASTTDKSAEELISKPYSSKSTFAKSFKSLAAFTSSSVQVGDLNNNTDEDVNAAKDLKDLANVDLDEYGLEMLKAGASTQLLTFLSHIHLNQHLLNLLNL